MRDPRRAADLIPRVRPTRDRAVPISVFASSSRSLTLRAEVEARGGGQQHQLRDTRLVSSSSDLARILSP